MKKVISLIVISLMVFVSCVNQSQEESKIVYKAFDKTVCLKAEKHEVPPSLLYPRNMFLLDSVLVIYNEMMDTLFQVFHKETLNYKYSFGLKGGGPEDFHMLSSYLVGSDGQSAVVQDLNTLCRISLRDGRPSITKIPIPVQRDYYNGMVQLKDSILLCNADFSDAEPFMFIYPSRELSFKENTERFGGDMAALKDAYAFYTVARPEGDRFAVFYAYQRKYCIYSSEGKLLREVMLDIQPYESEVSVDSEKRYIHTISVFATDNCIYALNLDMTAPEIMEQKHFPSVQVFSWDGKPLTCYELDCMISCFTVDEAEKRIYGAFAEDEDAIYTFRME